MIKIQAKERKRLAKLYPSPSPLVGNFIPSGRTHQVIYAVTIKQHPDKVKIGMTTKWTQRRKAYETWDLSSGDALVDSRVFVITEDFVDLRKIENHILKTFPMPLAFGSEWFHGMIDDAGRHIDRFLCEHGISYEQF